MTTGTLNDILFPSLLCASEDERFNNLMPSIPLLPHERLLLSIDRLHSTYKDPNLPGFTIDPADATLSSHLHLFPHLRSEEFSAIDDFNESFWKSCLARRALLQKPEHRQIQSPPHPDAHLIDLELDPLDPKRDKTPPLFHRPPKDDDPDPTATDDITNPCIFESRGDFVHTVTQSPPTRLTRFSVDHDFEALRLKVEDLRGDERAARETIAKYLTQHHAVRGQVVGSPHVVDELVDGFVSDVLSGDENTVDDLLEMVESSEGVAAKMQIWLKRTGNFERVTPLSRFSMVTRFDGS